MRKDFRKCKQLRFVWEGKTCFARHFDLLHKSGPSCTFVHYGSVLLVLTAPMTSWLVGHKSRQPSKCKFWLLAVSFLRKDFRKCKQLRFVWEGKTCFARHFDLLHKSGPSCTFVHYGSVLLVLTAPMTSWLVGHKSRQLPKSSWRSFFVAKRGEKGKKGLQLWRFSNIIN